MTSRGQCPRGVVLVNVSTTPPPLQEILYPRLDRDPPKALPYFAHWCWDITTYFDTSSQQDGGKVPQNGRKLVKYVPYQWELMVVATRWHQQVVVV